MEVTIALFVVKQSKNEDYYMLMRFNVIINIIETISFCLFNLFPFYLYSKEVTSLYCLAVIDETLSIFDEQEPIELNGQ